MNAPYRKPQPEPASDIMEEYCDTLRELLADRQKECQRLWISISTLVVVIIIGTLVYACHANYQVDRIRRLTVDRNAWFADYVRMSSMAVVSETYAAKNGALLDVSIEDANRCYRGYVEIYRCAAHTDEAAYHE